MRITDIRVLGRPELMGSWALLEVVADTGLRGVGMTVSPTEAVVAIVCSTTTGLRRLLVGEDARDVEQLWRRMYRDWQAERGRGGEGGLAVNAMAAIDLALWDLRGKHSGLPIHRLLGKTAAPRVAIYASATAADEHQYERFGQFRLKPAAQLATEARRLVEDGFDAIKFGFGRNFSTDGQESIAAIRRTIGSDVKLMLDFGCPAYNDQSWTIEEALRVAKMLERYDIEFWEEPLHPRDFEGYRALTEGSPVKIATGESLTQLDDFYRLIETGAVDVIQPDVQQIGMTQFIQVARRAEEAGIDCVPHCPWSAIAVAGHAQALATSRGGVMIEYPANFSTPSGSALDEIVKFTHRRLFENALTVEGSHVVLPDRPGLGLGNFVPEEVVAFEKLLSDGSRHA